VPQHLRRIG